MQTKEIIDNSYFKKKFWVFVSLIGVTFLSYLMIIALQIDYTLAQFFHTLLIDFPTIYPYVIWLNSRLGDWSYQIIICMICFLPKRKNKIRLFVQLMLFILITQLVFNTIIFKKLLNIYRQSPSYSFTPPSELLNTPNWRHRIFSEHCFPSNRGSFIFSIILFAHVYLDKYSKWLITIISPPLLLTRLIVGAHWLTDMLASILIVISSFLGMKMIFLYLSKKMKKTPFLNMFHWLYKG